MALGSKDPPHAISASKSPASGDLEHEVQHGRDDTEEVADEQGVSDERTLVARCRTDAHDTQAFRELYDSHVAIIFRRFMVVFGRRVDAEDATQLTFSEAFRSLASYDGRAPFGAWLRGIANHVVLNTLRAKTRRRRAMEGYVAEGELRAPSVPEPESLAEQRERVRSLDRHLEALSPERKTAFLLYYVDQCELTEVAAALRCSTDNAWAHIRRGRAQILEALAKEEHRAERRRWRGR